MGSVSTRTLWYLTRGAGVVSLLLLTAVVVLGVLTTVRWARPTWPRFASQQLHRNVSLLAVVFVLVHVVTAIADPFAPLRIVDAVIPLASRYRPIWIGFGAVAFDLLAALVVTSLVRVRLGHRSWRAVHWLAYACWPVAVVHGLGTGSDVKQGWLQLIAVSCTGAVVASVWWRVAHRWPTRPGPRIVGAVASLAVPVIIAAFTVNGPLKPGWARRAGTPPAILASVAGVNTASTVSQPTASGSLPSTARFAGTVSQNMRSDGTAAVTINGQLSASGTPRLDIVLFGQPLDNGGVAMTSSNVTLDAGGAHYSGSVNGLTGDVITAVLRGGGHAYQLQIALTLNGNSAAGAARLTAVAA